MTHYDADRLSAANLDRIDAEIESDLADELAALWERFDAEISMPWDDAGDMPIADIRLSIAAITHEAIDLEADDLLTELDDASAALMAIEIQNRIDRAAESMAARIRLASGVHGVFAS
jgi:hypothetical protein